MIREQMVHLARDSCEDTQSNQIEILCETGIIRFVT